MQEDSNRATLLAVGDRIDINGFVMLKGLEDGKTYEICEIMDRISMITHQPAPYAYVMRAVNKNGQLSTKKIAHTIGNIDSSIRSAAWCDNNIKIASSAKIEHSEASIFGTDIESNNESSVAMKR